MLPPADRRSCGLVSVEETVPPQRQDQQETTTGDARETPDTDHRTEKPEATEQSEATAPAGKPKGRGFRPDIQGMRALAVAMVVIYHHDPSLLPGGFAGVDVFFVISGFLITGHLLREYQKSGRVALLD